MPFAHLHSRATHPQSDTHAQKVLVIDDVDMNAALIAGVIRSLCEVQTASSGAQGLQMAQQYKPDLIVLDVMMPDMDGFEVFQQLKSDTRTAHIPVIFLTAMPEPSAEELGLNLGAADFIAKPFRTPVLLARVRYHLEQVQQRRMLERMTHVDALTGVANRRAFNAMLPREFSRLQRHNLPLALLMIDVDDFKAFNDHHGHIQGDECLQTIAQTIAQSLQRAADMVARYGGEEFVCLLPETDWEGAVQIAQNIQHRITQLQLTNRYAQAAEIVTVSIGVAAARASEVGSSQQLLALADQRLYRAKATGRNRIVATDTL